MDAARGEWRTEQPGRGRQAGAPQRIPGRGWKDILWRTYEESRHRPRYVIEERHNL